MRVNFLFIWFVANFVPKHTLTHTHTSFFLFYCDINAVNIKLHTATKR